jgi:lysophospholipase L1-like esterase
MNSNPTQFKKIALSNSLLLIVIISVPLIITARPFTIASSPLRQSLAIARGERSFGVNGGGGYYEDLMRHGEGQPVHTLIEPLIMGKIEREQSQPSEIYVYGGFEAYQGKPNLNLPNTTEGPIETNSYGFFDYNHLPEGPLNTRRIAIFGDSVARGWGIPMGSRFTSLFDTQLENAMPQQHFETLNFAASGYVLTQTFDVVLEKAPKFRPDVYILALTGLTASPDWGRHIAQLMRAGDGLKYDFLQAIAAQADIRKQDSPELSAWKLGPYREAILRQMLLKMKEHLARNSRQLLVVLVPTPESERMTELRFRPLRACLEGTNIPVIDLTDTFNGKDLEALRLSWYDGHPNISGHRMIAENLYNKLRENPMAWEAVTGESQRPAVEKATAGRR